MLRVGDLGIDQLMRQCIQKADVIGMRAIAAGIVPALRLALRKDGGEAMNRSSLGKTGAASHSLRRHRRAMQDDDRRIGAELLRRQKNRLPRPFRRRHGEHLIGARGTGRQERGEQKREGDKRGDGSWEGQSERQTHALLQAVTDREGLVQSGCLRIESIPRHDPRQRTPPFPHSSVEIAQVGAQVTCRWLNESNCRLRQLVGFCGGSPRSQARLYT